MSNESPIVSFRIPLDVVNRLIAEGKLPEDYNKSALSNLVKDTFLNSIGAEVQKPVDVNDVYSKLSEISERLAALEKAQDINSVNATPKSASTKTKAQTKNSQSA